MSGAAAESGAEAGIVAQMRNDTYSAAIVDHYENPRNVGSFPAGAGGVGTGVVGTPASGEVMRLQIKVDPTSCVISDARFKAYGSGPAIAACSLLTEWVRGRTLEQAGAIKSSQIVLELQMPAAKMHSAFAAEGVLRAAIADYRRRNGASGTMTATED